MSNNSSLQKAIIPVKAVFPSFNDDEARTKVIRSMRHALIQDPLQSPIYKICDWLSSHKHDLETIETRNDLVVRMAADTQMSKQHIRQWLHQQEISLPKHLSIRFKGKRSVIINEEWKPTGPMITR